MTQKHYKFEFHPQVKPDFCAAGLDAAVEVVDGMTAGRIDPDKIPDLMTSYFTFKRATRQVQDHQETGLETNSSNLTGLNMDFLLVPQRRGQSLGLAINARNPQRERYSPLGEISEFKIGDIHNPQGGFKPEFIDQLRKGEVITKTPEALTTYQIITQNTPQGTQEIIVEQEYQKLGGAYTQTKLEKHNLQKQK